MKVRANELTDKERMEIFDSLYTAAASVKGRDAVKLFLRDLLTESERIMLGRRIMIARKLIAKKDYDTIAAEMRVGRDTIWRVQKWLLDKLPGYEQAVKGLEAEMSRREFNKNYAQSAFFRLKKRYPGHFLLFPWGK